ncbi:MAG: hypothetical protein ABFS02_08355 [Pseudomonadota bacterium]
MRTRIVLLVLLVFSALQVPAQESALEVVPLSNRPAEDLLPLLLPFLEEDERAVANGSDLVLKSSPRRMAELKNLIRDLDKRQRDLLVTVLQGSNLTADELNARARLHIHIPLEAPAGTRGNFRGRYYSTQRGDALENTQQLRTLEGKAAIIKIAREIPYQNFGIYGADPYGYGTSSTEFRDVTTGFAVIPRLTGNGHVMLEISPWSAHRSRIGDGVIETRSAQTTIRAALGEWVEIGGQNETSRTEQKGILSRHYRTDTGRHRILIRVEALSD